MILALGGLDGIHSEAGIFLDFIDVPLLRLAAISKLATKQLKEEDLFCWLYSRALLC